jgi:hypothetical protein
MKNFKTNFSIDLNKLNQLKTEFYSYEIDQNSEVNNHATLKREIEYSIQRGMGQQLGRISEQLVAEALACANNMKLDETSFTSDFRHKYSNKDYSLLVLGGSGLSDLVVINKDGVRYTLEVKEPAAYLCQVDVVYDNTGMNYSIISREYNKFFDEALKNISFNIFDNLGHNSIIKTKGLPIKSDFLVSFSKEGNGLFIPAAEIPSLDVFQLEFRTTGKNTRKLWSLDKFKSLVEEDGGKVDGKNIVLPLSAVKPIKGRGKEEITQYAFHNIFKLRKEYSVVDNNFISIPLDKVKQNTCNLSIQYLL